MLISYLNYELIMIAIFLVSFAGAFTSICLAARHMHKVLMGTKPGSVVWAGVFATFSLFSKRFYTAEGNVHREKLIRCIFLFFLSAGVALAVFLFG